MGGAKGSQKPGGRNLLHFFKMRPAPQREPARGEEEDAPASPATPAPASSSGVRSATPAASSDATTPARPTPADDDASVLGKRRKKKGEEERRAALDRLATAKSASKKRPTPPRKRLRKASSASPPPSKWDAEESSSDEERGGGDDGDEDFVVSDDGAEEDEEEYEDDDEEASEEEDYAAEEDEDEEEEEPSPRKKKKKTKKEKKEGKTRKRDSPPSSAGEQATPKRARTSEGGAAAAAAPASDPLRADEVAARVAQWARGASAAATASASENRGEAETERGAAPAPLREAFAGQDGGAGGDAAAAAAAAADGGGRKTESFLLPENVRDASRRRPGEPGYDPTTLYVPKSFVTGLSPGKQQYWEMKAKNRDVVLFFKMGKFYELFDDDADIGARELGLAYMKGDRRHAGFPEAAFGKYAKQLVHLGYRVGRVEQTETPEELKEYNRSMRAGSKRKVVRREMVQLLTKGTLVDLDLIEGNAAAYLLAVTESAPSDAGLGDGHDTAYGVCFVDTATGTFHLGQFGDNRQRSRLRTLLAQLRPEEVVYPRDVLSPGTMAIFSAELRGGVIRNPIRNREQFCDGYTAAGQLEDLLGPMPDKAAAGNAAGSEGKTWPAALVFASESQPLAMSAVGGCLFYLRRALLDREMVTQRRFGQYRPADLLPAEMRLAVPEGVPEERLRVWGAAGDAFMVLDGQTLENLEVLENADGGTGGTLLKLLDHTVTPFGSRTMKQWVAQPLGTVAGINDRLDAVRDLMDRPDLVEDTRRALRQLPDLERRMSRIHADGLARDKDAVMYTNVSHRKVKDFVDLLHGFRAADNAVRAFGAETGGMRSARLRALATPGRLYPDLSGLLEFFDGAFNHADAKRDGQIVPQRGVEPEYDSCRDRVTAIKLELDETLAGLKRRLRTGGIKYVDKGNERYQIEIKMADISKLDGGLPADFEQKSSTKTVKRFWTPRVSTLAAELGSCEERRDALLRGVMRGMFVRFCESLTEWSAAARAVAELDCLISLSYVSELAPAGRSCRPTFVEPSDAGGPFFEARGSVHPAVAADPGSTFSGGDFIPNDIVIGGGGGAGGAGGGGGDRSRFLLVSGPNMGGKSTLLRQACVLAVMAQLGCHVPAESMRLTPMDRIFTRVGANDRIMQGQSTFLVELEETANILRHATPRSLVILDELGRGTSTFDGTAIAHSVIRFLSREVRCLALFSTHYHMLLEEFADDPLIAMFHMACRVNSSDDDVTFLYKFVEGVCPKSYGMNVGRLAGLPDSVVCRARDMAALFELRLAEAHQSPGDAAAAALGGEVAAAVRAAASGDASAMARLPALREAAARLAGAA